MDTLVISWSESFNNASRIGLCTIAPRNTSTTQLHRSLLRKLSMGLRVCLAEGVESLSFSVGSQSQRLHHPSSLGLEVLPGSLYGILAWIQDTIYPENHKDAVAFRK